MYALCAGGFLLGGLVLVVGGIMLLVAAFRVSVAWGLLVLLLGPVGLFFVATHWQIARRSICVLLAGVLVALCSVGIAHTQDSNITGDLMRKVRSAETTIETDRIPPLPIRSIANGGKRIKIGPLLVPGKITVIDFYEKTCEPCLRLDPLLEQITREEPDVYLCKIDVGNLSSPVMFQHRIRGVPHVLVFDRNGKAAGDPVYKIDAIRTQIERAK